MTKAKHTYRPWRIGSEQRANARLIATATDLLQAAKAALDHLARARRECEGEGDDSAMTYIADAIDELRSAIAKAEGGAT